MLLHPGLPQARRHLLRAGSEEKAAAELRELAPDVGQVRAHLHGQRLRLSGQVVLLGVCQDLVALPDEHEAADAERDDAGQQQRYDEDGPQLETAQETSTVWHVYEQWELMRVIIT